MISVVEERRNREKAEAIAGTVESAFAQEVVQARIHFDEDWMGAPAIYVHIVLTDAVSRRTKGADVSLQITDFVNTKFREEEVGIIPYMRFRSESEYREMKDPHWG